MLGSFFDLRREVEAIAARRERESAARPADRVYEDFDHEMNAFLRSVTPGSPVERQREIKIKDLSSFDGR